MQADPDEKPQLLTRDKVALLWSFLNTVKLAAAGKQNPIGTTINHLSEHAEGELSLKSAQEAAPKIRYWLTAVCKPILERLSAENHKESNEAFIEDMRKTAEVLMGIKPANIQGRFNYVAEVLEQWDWAKTLKLAKEHGDEYKKICQTLKADIDANRSPSANVSEGIVHAIVCSINSS